MRSLFRLRVFLLCCLLMIGMNVMLTMGGVFTAGSATGDTGLPPGCDGMSGP